MRRFLLTILVETIAGIVLGPLIGAGLYEAAMSGHHGGDPDLHGMLIFGVCWMVSPVLGVLLLDLVLYRLDWRMLIGCCTGGIVAGPTAYLLAPLLKAWQVPGFLIVAILVGSFAYSYNLAFPPRRFRWAKMTDEAAKVRADDGGTPDNG
jgi:hypothetical protein